MASNILKIGVPDDHLYPKWHLQDEVKGGTVSTVEILLLRKLTSGLTLTLPPYETMFFPNDGEEAEMLQKYWSKFRAAVGHVTWVEKYGRRDDS
jgi:hypothetical protein